MFESWRSIAAHRGKIGAWDFHCRAWNQEPISTPTSNTAHVLKSYRAVAFLRSVIVVESPLGKSLFGQDDRPSCGARGRRNVARYAICGGRGGFKRKVIPPKI